MGGEHAFQPCSIFNEVLSQETSQTVNAATCLENLHERGTELPARPKLGNDSALGSGCLPGNRECSPGDKRFSAALVPRPGACCWREPSQGGGAGLPQEFGGDDPGHSSLRGRTVCTLSIPSLTPFVTFLFAPLGPPVSFCIEIRTILFPHLSVHSVHGAETSWLGRVLHSGCTFAP